MVCIARTTAFFRVSDRYLGVSQPAVQHVDPKLLPGQEAVRQGIILCGRDGDVDGDKYVPPPFFRRRVEQFLTLSRSNSKSTFLTY